MDNPSAAPAPGHPSAEGPLHFYWEFDEPDRSDLQARALVDEGYLASQLNHGIAMLAVRLSDEENPDLRPLPAYLTDPETHQLAISAILQVAAWQGLDLDDILEEAVEGMGAMFRYSADAASSRPAHG